MENKTFNKVRNISLWTLFFSCCVYILFMGVFVWIPSLQFKYFQVKLNHFEKTDSISGKQLTLDNLSKSIKILENKLDKLNPSGSYIIINTTENSFKLYKNKSIIREGICSTGSYVELEAENEKKWVFETPKGVFTVKGKITNPVWRKPDWAFAEEGLPIPSANDPSRYEYGVLGDYALSIGDGYLIHGTLYQRFLGMAVTHGCVRLNDSDLEFVYKELPVGAKVFIY